MRKGNFSGGGKLLQREGGKLLQRGREKGLCRGRDFSLESLDSDFPGGRYFGG